jgi:hypothetical protein
VTLLPTLSPARLHGGALERVIGPSANPALTPPDRSRHSGGVSDSVPASSLLTTLRWLSAHTRFPASRLPAKAETLLLIATAAQQEETNANANASGLFHIKSRDGAKESALRAHALRRSMVHFKCDNSAKV